MMALVTGVPTGSGTFMSMNTLAAKPPGTRLVAVTVDAVFPVVGPWVGETLVTVGAAAGAEAEAAGFTNAKVDRVSNTKASCVGVSTLWPTARDPPATSTRPSIRRAPRLNIGASPAIPRQVCERES